MKTEKKGRLYLILLLSSIVLLQVVLIAVFHYRGLHSQIEFRYFRAFFIILFCVLTFHKYKVAKWVLIAWWIFSILKGIHLMRTSFDFNQLFLTVFYIIVVILVQFHPKISAYLNSNEEV